MGFDLLANLTASGLLAASAIAGGGTVSAEPTIVAAPFMEAQTVDEYTEQYVREVFADVPVMIEVAKCESHLKHFDENRKVIKNRSGSSAVGVFQIMASIHAEDAKNMGHDIMTIEGNVDYARHLYETSGTKPWEADKSSSACWGKTNSGKAHFAKN
jgi:hypothetical protein